MIILGNIALSPASACYFGFTSMIEKSAPSDQFATGHAFTHLLSVTVFLMCMVLIAVTIFRIDSW